MSDLQENVSALHLASRNGHKAIVQLLVERGVDINIKVHTLYVVVVPKKLYVVLYFISNGLVSKMCDIRRLQIENCTDSGNPNQIVFCQQNHSKSPQMHKIWDRSM